MCTTNNPTIGFNTKIKEITMAEMTEQQILNAKAKADAGTEVTDTSARV